MSLTIEYLGQLFQCAEVLRIHDHAPERVRVALRLYAIILEELEGHDGPTRPLQQQSQHMAGVCCKMLGDYARAIEYFNAALGVDAREVLAGNILRDRAGARAMLGHHEDALDDIRAALTLLPADDPGHWASKGFEGRILLRMDEVEEALQCLRKADAELKRLDNRHFELYNKFPLAVALIVSGEPGEAGRVLAEAEQLIPEYGSDKHRGFVATLSEHLLQSDEVRRLYLANEFG